MSEYNKVEENNDALSKQESDIISNSLHQNLPEINTMTLQRTQTEPNSLSSNDVIQLQRLIGNQGVLNLLKTGTTNKPPKAEQPTSQPKDALQAFSCLQRKASPTQSDELQANVSSVTHNTDNNHAIQRKVYIKGFGGYRRKTKMSDGQIGTGDRNLATMASDDKKRYFHSKAEMYDYANEATDHMGFYDGQWIRLDPDDFLVIGEKHKAGSWLADITRAIGTERFMYEGYTDTPQAPTDELSDAMQQRKQHMDEQFDTPDDGVSHIGEDFYPKVLRGMNGIKITDISKYRVYFEGTKGALLFAWGLLDAASSEDEVISYIYDENRDIYDQTAAQLVAGTTISQTVMAVKMKEDQSDEIFTAFVGAYNDYANEKIAMKEDETPEQKSAFDEKWHLAEPEDYSDDVNSPIMQAERARDFSMYLHILQARSDGYMLYGLGKLHQNRLDMLLDDENIKHITREQFDKQQARKHPR